MKNHQPTSARTLILFVMLLCLALPSRLAALWHRKPILTHSVTARAQATALSEPQRSINTVAFSADGTMIAVGGDDQTVRLWNAQSGKVQRVWRTQCAVVSLAFSPDSQLLAAADAGELIRLWDIHSVQDQSRLTIHSSVSSLAFSPDGKNLAGAQRQVAQLWNVITGELEQSYWEASNGIRSLAYSPDGTRLATGGGDLKIWKIQAGTCRLEPTPPHTLQDLEAAQKQSLLMERGTSAVAWAVFSPDGSVVASASNNTIGLWSVETGRLLRTLTGKGDVEAVAFSSEGKIVAAAGQDGTIRLWQTETGMLMRKWQPQTGAVKCLAFSPKEPLLVIGGERGAVLLWDVTTGTLKKALH